jgi:phosphate-selective porin OprO and OprP
VLPAGAQNAPASSTGAAAPTSLPMLDGEIDADGGDAREPGVAFESSSGDSDIRVWLRGQFRYSTPFDADPLSSEDFAAESGSDFDVRRGRLKAEGHLFDSRYGFYFEHELTGASPLLDLRMDLDLAKRVQLRIGQYKVLYNRERVDSSGKQQFVERSIATYPFTLDRQRGLTIGTHWAEGRRGDNWLMVGAFEGGGRDAARSGDDPMWVARWQWQIVGEPLQFAQSDYGYSARPRVAIGFAAARVTGPYTRFSSSGGGQLDGFEVGDDERYTLEQWMQEFAWKYAGMSVQQEFHVKRIEDNATGQRSEITGGYLQFGKTWQATIDEWTRPVELALRIARVEWEGQIAREQNEVTVAANLYLAGHDNKLTLDLSRIGVDAPTLPRESDIRVRVQWDVSF